MKRVRELCLSLLSGLMLLTMLCGLLPSAVFTAGTEGGLNTVYLNGASPAPMVMMGQAPVRL